MADVLLLFQNNREVPHDIEERHIEQVRAACTGPVTVCRGEEEALAGGIDAEVLYTWGGSGIMPQAWCAASRRLKWIHSFSAGVNPIMDSPISKLPVRLTNAKGIHGKTMGVTAIGYIISFLRGFPQLRRQQEAHIWDKTTVQLLEPTGLTVGIVGAGAIAGEVARLCKAMDMRVLGVKRTVTPLEHYDGVYANGELELVLGQSDFVVVLTPLTAETRGLIGARELAYMKRSGVLINMARGPVVDTAALVEALQNGVIGGAALDAVDPEPLPADSPLWDMPNTVITPHCAADSNLYMDRAIAQFCENLKRYERGEPLFNEVDMRRSY